MCDLELVRYFVNELFFPEIKRRFKSRSKTLLSLPSSSYSSYHFSVQANHLGFRMIQSRYAHVLHDYMRFGKQVFYDLLLTDLMITNIYYYYDVSSSCYKISDRFKRRLDVPHTTYLAAIES